ncbi:kinase-like protein [Hesseltinella vesiculosa]|uniref:Kinase-like protein n=1 Tax=Hesseltinella vesiculosa TaxID=101127 RepID=A0A1X2GBL6_9FUNG|nr:kinase-like protein [Hesseltinella vesiculosa]
MTLTPTHKGFQKWSTYTKKKKPSLVPRPPLLLALTVNIGSTLERIDPSFSYDPDSNPKRILTRPSKPAKNDGYDNEHSDYILFVNDILGEGETRRRSYRYRVIDLLGQGTYGQVVKCEHLATKELYSVKVVKNRANFRSESYMEANILKRLNEHPGSKEHILTLVTTFIHKNHFCLVFELLSFNLLELIRQTGFRGLPIALVRTISHQLLQALDFLLQSSVIHCDLKPENILLESVDSPKIKVIDFGSACYRTTPKYTYIQSRYYRSPEVILKVPYSHGIDMWSLGCIVAELFLGSPLFPGHTEFHQLNLIMDLLGEPMSEVLERGKDTFYYFDLESQHGRTIFKRKPVDKYNKDHNKAEKAHAPAHKYTTLKDIIMNHGQHHINKERLHPLGKHISMMREQLTDFLQQCLNLRPLQRWKPAAALTHPFITGVFELPAHPQPGLRHQRSRSLHAPNASVHRDQASLEPRRRATFTSHTDAERRTKKIHPGAASASAGPN